MRILFIEFTEKMHLNMIDVTNHINLNICLSLVEIPFVENPIVEIPIVERFPLCSFPLLNFLVLCFLL